MFVEWAGDTVQLLTNDWFFLIVIAVVYWTIDKNTGLKLLIVVALSVYFHGLIKQTFSPVPSAGSTSFTFPAREVQLATSFWGFLIPEISKRRFTLLACVIIALIAVMTFLNSSHSFQDIIMAVLVGAFVVFAVYRSMDWIGSVPEPFLFSFSLVLPSSLLLLFPEGGPYAGLLLGAGAGYSLEKLKCRMVVSTKIKNKVITAAVGLIGLVLIALSQNLLPSTILLYFLHAALLGFWITLVTPFLSVKLKLNDQKGQLRTF
ncbi:hypothetical protein [Salibacterium aidingense]|uniref:hypothetical protein n=1 Tax=Salibacterium aidingense TaxID=384933 RepID=UPI003BE9DE11